MPPVLDQVQQQSAPPAQEREGARLRRAYEEKKGRSLTHEDLGPHPRSAIVELLRSRSDRDKLVELLGRLKGVDYGRGGGKAAYTRKGVRPETLPVPADDPTLIDLFYATINKIGPAYRPHKPYRPPKRPPSHGIDA